MALGLYGRWEPERLFAFMTTAQLKAYIDESGTHGSSPITVMSGFIGYADRWDSFDAHWRQILTLHSLDYVHAKELRQGTGQFKDKRRWNLAARKNFAAHVAVIPQRFARFSISVILTNADYDRVYIGGDRKLRRHRHPVDSKYGTCCRVFMSLVARFVEKYEADDKQVHLVFEAGHRNSGAAETILAEMYDVAPDLARFISPQITYALKLRSPGVQAADLLAYPVFTTELEGGVSIPIEVGVPPKILLGDCPNFRAPISPETLEGIKSGQLAGATLKRQKGRYWTALDGLPDGWSARPLRSVEGFVLTPPHSSIGLLGGAANHETPLPAHSVQLRCL
jgi:Protein of unknown function (DUF3800)